MGRPLTDGVFGVGNISSRCFGEIPKLMGLRLLAAADRNEMRAGEIAAGRGS